jgi:hypothetical protein
MLCPFVFKYFEFGNHIFLQIQKFDVANLMNMLSRVRFHILTTLGSREDKAWEYNENDHILTVHLYKLLSPINYDDEEQMSDILAHVHLGVVDHVVIHAFVESYTRDRYDARSMTLYHPINIRCFLELDDLVQNPPPNVLVDCKSHGDIDDDNE